MELETSFYMAQLLYLLVVLLVGMGSYFTIDNKNIRFWVALMSQFVVGAIMLLFFPSLLGFFPA